MKYERINDDQKLQMLDQRLTQYEQEHYNHAVNLALLRATRAIDDGTKVAIKQAEEALATLDAAHANVKTEQAKVGSPAKAAPLGGLA
jgi:hypothetical protein